MRTMIQGDALELIDRLRNIHVADLVTTCRDCDMSEANILVLLATEPVMGPIAIQKFASPIDLGSMQRLEEELSAMDPKLIRELVASMIRKDTP